MAQGRIAKSRRRYPEARRRMARYGNTRYGKRTTKLPPNLLPSAGEERRNGDGTMTTTRRFLILGALVFLAVSAFGFAGFVIISAALGVTGTVAAYEEVNKDLPDAAGVAVGTFQTTTIYDRNGVLLQEVDNPDYGWRTYVSLDQINDNLINATVAAEDSTFWTNQGVEPFAILRGGLIIFSGSGSSGGSTITQQLVRSLYPEQIGNDYSLLRKGREALAAVALNKKYSKTDIMTMYLNQIYYGARAYGIQAASETYFNKNAADLDLAEASLLAGLPQAPSYYDPSDPEKFGQAKIRQQYVLDQMVKYRYITRDESEAAWKQPLDPQGTRSGAVQNAPHFTEWVREYVIENFGEEALYSGLQITTSIDLALQQEAEQLVVNGVADMANRGYDRNNGAMVIMVPWSGEVLAMVGSADFDDASINGQVNFATSLIQPGSSMKPIVYAAAFEQGWNPATVVMDVPTTWKVENQEDYKPNNYSKQFYGAVTVRQALANSFNVTAVKAADFVGVPGVMSMSRRMGIVDSLQEDAGFYGVSIGLGSAEVELIEHTNAYATLANNGKFVPAHPIIKIEDGQGNALYELNKQSIDEQATQGLPAGNAYQITSILTDNEARAQIFSTNNLFGNTQTQLGRPVAAKSGTTENWRDLWTMGYTTDVAVGVWVGKSGDGGTTDLPEIDGIQAAGPIWEKAMYLMHDTPAYEALLRGPDGNALPAAFPVPSDVQERTLCAATGHRAGNGEEVTEWVVESQQPTLACGELSSEESKELDLALAEARRGSVNWASGAVASINEYARVASRQGTSNSGGQQEIEQTESNDNNSDQSGEENPEDQSNSEDESQTDEQSTEEPQSEENPEDEQVIEPAD